MSTESPHARQGGIAVVVSDELVIAWWKDWYQFLTLRLDKLTIRARGLQVDAAFDGDEGDDAARERTITDGLARIPSARRTVFETVLDATARDLRRTQNDSAADTDVLAREREALELLRQKAQGDRVAGVMAEVPTADGWYVLDPAVMDQVPAAEVYAATARERRSRGTTILVFGGLAIGFVIFALYYWSLLNPASPAAATASTVPLVNDAPNAAWPVRAMQLGARELPLEVIATARWPRPSSATAAGWRDGSILPMQLCIPATEVVTLSTSLTLIGSGAHPNRTFTLSADAPADPSLRLVRCAKGDAIAYGRLASMTPQPAAAAGAAQELPDLGVLTLRSARILGPGQDPTIPNGRVRVLVELTARAGVDWPRYQPLLILANGQEARHIEVRPAAGVDGGTTVVYDIAAPTASLAAAWQISDPTSGASVRWRMTLNPPRTRDEELTSTTHLAVRAAGWEGQTLTVTLQVATIGAVPLSLRPEDFAASQDGQPITISPFPSGTVPVPTGKTAELIMTIVGNPQAPTLIYLGAHGVTISPP